MSNLERRIEQLEQSSGGGGVVILRMYDTDYHPFAPDMQARLLAEAAARDPGADVVTIVLVQDWRSNEPGETYREPGA